MATSDDQSRSDLPVKAIPGSYGIPYYSAVRDRLDFYYFQGQDGYFTSRVAKYGSTVVRINVPPGPFMARDPRVVALLDGRSFPVLFDVSKVEKRDVFTGTYMPSTSLTGGFRVCSYLDPSEPAHAAVKQLLFSLLSSRGPHVAPAFHSSYSSLFDTMESQLSEAAASKSDFNKLNDVTALDFLGDAFYGSRFGPDAPSKAAKWLLFQLHPLMTLGLPKILEEPLLHTFHLPPCLVRKDYKSLYSYFAAETPPGLLERAEKLGLSKEEAQHNLLFATIFNSYGGLKVLLPGILSFLAKSGPELHAKVVKEVRDVTADQGNVVTPESVLKMELVKSVVYESLRMDPPVKFQYGRAKKDLVVESHDAAFEVKKGEMLFGYQPLATRDERVFGPTAGKFVAERFVGEEGRKLLKHVLWSNGPETESPTVGDKQCAGKDFVVLVGRLMVAEFFRRYDTFTADVGTDKLGVSVTVTSLTRAKNTNNES